ncbi:3-alpha,7-alpha,12-alpha-trihydroxy-5-beta-cholest-24-enoyl-CoA hydratase [Streptomyces varsoviensis]|uniref:3-alpha,7-alpha, 12-alpha-trihydroxy-5-beta-cholest-24-enoyl-CoA hydratase n=1 Tax=Streptomyces varsoviensis TaxID=67373 RepID=A0ABR5J8H7_9ACTN|nr:3-alpha,7-alpha,12-alpha-trihydroxy-5-beta-cholest-24-enoyl-CoA hydratase [Streptomyces varsoviensis]
MPIDAAKAISAEPRSTDLTWDQKDVQLYHLGIGAGRPATDPDELRYVLESKLHVLPSFATVAGAGLAVVGGLSAPGIDVDLAAVLHGSQRIDLHRPIPVKGTATHTSSVPAVYDKGKAAVIVLRSEVADADGPLWTSDTQIFVRGEGGFGGERGPLHADPEFAKLAGFDRPILHGLCTYGIALKAVVDTALGGDVTRVRSYSARFTGVVFPGETLRIGMWREAGRVQVSVTAAERDDAPVLGDTVVEYA